MEVLLVAVFSVWSAQRLYRVTDQVQFSLLGAVHAVEWNEFVSD
jgi:hypothetical protein